MADFASTPDLARIKRNVAKMAFQNAPESDIDGYIASEGVTIDDVKNFKGWETGPWTTYQQQALNELNRRQSAQSEGPWTKFQNNGITKEAAQAELDRRQSARTGSRTFNITAPDGRKYRVTGDNEEGALNALRKHLGDDGGPKPRFNGIPVEGDVPTSSGEAFRRSFIDGMPIVGPMLRGGAERLAAGVVAAIDPNRTYDDVRASQQQRAEELTANHPIASTTGQISGSVAGTIPMIAAAPSAFGAGSGNLFMRTLASGASGATIGGTDAAIRSEGDPEAIKQGIYWGGGAGLAGPAVAKVIGSGVNAISRYHQTGQAAAEAGLDRTALKNLSRAATDDEITAPLIQQRMEMLGDNGMLADLGPNLQRQAAALAAKPGRGQEIVRGAIQSRDAGANTRILQALDGTLGPASVPSAVDDSIVASQRSLSPMYQDALSGASAVDTSAIAQGLDDAAIGLRGDAQTAVNQVRKMLNVTGSDALDSNPATLLATRQAIDDMLGSPSMGGNAARVLRDIRGQVDQVLADAAPGLKSIDARYQELARQRTALEDGGRLLDGGRNAMRPQELADELADGVQPRGELIGPSAAPMRMREGARAEIERIVGTNGNDRIKLERLIGGEGDWNRSKLAMLFGKDKADRILNMLASERQFAETSAIVTRNSETAARAAAMEEVGGLKSGSGFGVKEAYQAGGSLGALRSAGVRAAEKAFNSIGRAGLEKSNEGLAKALTSRNNFEEIIKALGVVTKAKQPSETQMKILRALMMGPAITQTPGMMVPSSSRIR